MISNLNRKEFLQLLSLFASGSLLNPQQLLAQISTQTEFSKADFGKDFLWGVSTAAYQMEGAFQEDGKSSSIWDTFSQKHGHIRDGTTGDIACDFYHTYASDLDIVKSFNMNVFRFSTAWSRVLPEGTGRVNQKGIDFYHRVIDKCLENNLQPWLTLYHWDIPQVLQDKGGWMNRDVIEWFSEYTYLMTKSYGDKVKDWIVLNEPTAFTVVGYGVGVHAPGIRGINHLLPTIHHAAICQAEGARIVRSNVSNANIGSTFSCSHVMPLRNLEKDHIAVERWDALLNRLFIEPSLGMGYPISSLPFLRNIDKHIKDGDMEKLAFDFDFIGIQNYTREVVKNIWFIPYMHGLEINPSKRGAKEISELGWEVYPESLYETLKRFSAYKVVKKIYVTENGYALQDKVIDNKVHDIQRINYFKSYLAQMLKAKNDGVNVGGYLCWTLLDNFEWREGYKPRYGLVYVDFKTQQRIIKDSGYWFKEFLK
jgi:beta-glucosidase